MSLSYSTDAGFLAGERCLSSLEALLLVATDPICLVSGSTRGVVVPEGRGLSIGVSRSLLECWKSDVLAAKQTCLRF